MKIPSYSVTIEEPLVCVKENRLLLLKVCVAVLAVVGVIAVGAVAWAEFTWSNLNKVALIPRLILAAIAALSGVGCFKCIREERVKMKLSFYQDYLTIHYDRHPSLWAEGSPSLTLQVNYRDVTSAIFSTRRCRVTFQTKKYTRFLGERGAKTAGGAVSFSTLGAMDVDFAQLIEKNCTIRVMTKD